MNRLSLLTIVATILYAVALSCRVLAADSPAPANTAPSIQDQLNELRQGQQRILQELEAIKSRLSEGPGRAEFGAKLPGTNLITLNVHGEPFRGSPQARIVIMEYSDFACSFCARYAREVYPSIQQRYVDSGKIRYYFRDLPAPEHTNSLLLARAARCAGAQGKFWEMHDRLFALQSEPMPNPIAALDAAAGTIGLDSTGFDQCLQSDRFTDNIHRSILSAEHIGIYGTPALIIGTLSETGDFLRSTNLLVGAESYETIAAAVDELLKAKSQP